MFDSDRHIRNFALTLWANYIETGNVATSRHDVRPPDKPNVLSDDQQRFVQRLRDMARAELSQ